LKLQVFPVAPKSRKTIEYTMEVPTIYEAGADTLHLERMGTEARAAEVTVNVSDPRDRIFVAGKVVAPGTRLRFPARGPLGLVLERHDTTRLGGSVAVVPFAPQRVLTHARVEVTGKLSQAPRGASVVVVLDGSRSLDDSDADAERAAAAAYLKNMPDANVEILVFDRAVHGKYGRLEPALTAIADLERSAIVRRNGSAIELAMAEADNLLARSPAGARRVLLLTDMRTRIALEPEKLTRAFAKSGALVHIGSIGDGSPSLTRSDSGPWSAIARATGGVQWFGSATADANVAGDMRAVFEEWARPIRIDRVTAKTPGVAEDLAIPESIAEGTSFDVTRIDTSQMTALTVEGEVWAAPIAMTLRPDAQQGKLWSALVFGSSIQGALSEAEQMTLAKLGHAVSPVTSLLAIEPGVRPSTEGLDDHEGQGFGSGHGRLGGSHRAHAPFISSFDHAAFLKDALAPAWRACAAGGKTATIAIETTRAEIVDIQHVTIDATAPKSAETCLREAAWALALPNAFSRESAAFSVELRSGG
jgi:hypothetical protein